VRDMSVVLRQCPLSALHWIDVRHMYKGLRISSLEAFGNQERSVGWCLASSFPFAHTGIETFSNVTGPSAPVSGYTTAQSMNLVM
jgi:hypothetical protein